MSKKFTSNKIHRADPAPQNQSQVVSTVENITTSAKATVKKNRAPLIFLLVLAVLSGLGLWVFQEIKADQRDGIQQALYDLTASPPADGQEESRIAALEELLGKVKGQQAKSFYLRIVSTLIEQADPAVADSASPFSITTVSDTPDTTREAGKRKMLEAAGRISQRASEKYSDLADWNKKIQTVVRDETDQTWLHKPRAYRLLAPKAGASK